MPRGALRDADVELARGEVLREVLACGWLSREFITKQQHHPHPAAAAAADAEAAVCTAETSRWLFEVATDPSGTRETGLRARRLLASLGFGLRDICARAQVAAATA